MHLKDQVAMVKTNPLRKSHNHTLQNEPDIGNGTSLVVPQSKLFRNENSQAYKEMHGISGTIGVSDRDIKKRISLLPTIKMKRDRYETERLSI